MTVYWFSFDEQAFSQHIHIYAHICTLTQQNYFLFEFVK